MTLLELSGLRARYGAGVPGADPTSFVDESLRAEALGH